MPINFIFVRVVLKVPTVAKTLRIVTSSVFSFVKTCIPTPEEIGYGRHRGGSNLQMLCFLDRARSTCLRADAAATRRLCNLPSSFFTNCFGVLNPGGYNLHNYNLFMSTEEVTLRGFRVLIIDALRWDIFFKNFYCLHFFHMLKSNIYVACEQVC